MKAHLVETALGRLMIRTRATVVDVTAFEDTARYLLAFPSSLQRERFVGLLTNCDQVAEAEWERHGDNGLELTTCG